MAVTSPRSVISPVIATSPRMAPVRAETGRVIAAPALGPSWRGAIGHVDMDVALRTFRPDAQHAARGCAPPYGRSTDSFITSPSDRCA